jgi:peptidase M15-like protein
LPALLVRRLFRSLVTVWLTACVACVATDATAGTRRPADPYFGLLGPQAELDELSWLSTGVHQSRPFRLAPDPSLSLLAHYLAPAQNHVADWRSFFRGDYGLSSWTSRFSLHWSLESDAPKPEALSVSMRGPCPKWRAPRPVSLARFDGAERVTLPLIDCDGGVAPDAIDVVSVLSRAPGVPRPELPLPFEPSADAGPGEWLPHVKLIDPRLIWVLEQVAEAFPRRTLYIMSGYRQNGHSGNHGKGKAIDLFVYGVANDQLFGVCRRLHDVGCGFYPNNKFVHIDVRSYGTDRVLWVDDSQPGTPSHYLDGFEGVLEPGRSWIPSWQQPEE